MNATTIIHDGYTQSGYIAAVDGLHGEFCFEYRPMLVEQRDFCIEQARKRPAGEFIGIMAAAIHKQIATWDARDSKDQPIAPSPDVIRRLQPALFDKLYGIIIGTRANDRRDDAPAAESDQWSRDLLAAAEQSRPIGDVKQEVDAKN